MKFALYKMAELPFDNPQLYRNLVLGRNGLILCIVRDPRSLVTSTYDGKDYWRETRDDFEVLHPFMRWQRMAFHAMGNMSVNRSWFHLVRYEDLLTRPASCQADIGMFLNCPPTVSFSRAHEVIEPEKFADLAMNGIRPLDPSRAAVPDVDALAERGYTLDSMTIKIMERIGYEI